MAGFQILAGIRKTLPSRLIDEVIDRNECSRLPDWFVPLAPGVLIASDKLLLEVGHHHGMYCPRGWRKFDRDCYRRAVGGQPRLMCDVLKVRRYDKHGWWMIERRMVEVDEVLVFNFGSAPIVTRSHGSAMRLAMHCHVNDPPHGLRWVKQEPDDCSGAIEFARQRHIDDALCAINGQP